MSWYKWNIDNSCVTEQRLQRGAALLQTISGVRGREEHGRRESATANGDLQPEAHGGQEGLPPGNAADLNGQRGRHEGRSGRAGAQPGIYRHAHTRTHTPTHTYLVLHALLRRVHGVAVTTLDALQRLFYLRKLVTKQQCLP